MKSDINSRLENNFPAILKRLREENNMTQQQLADFLNLERSSVAKYEKGKSTPNPETLLAISKIFNTTVDYLIKGTQTEVANTVHSQIPEYNESPLPIIDTQRMFELTNDEQFLVVYFRMLDRDPKILEQLRDEFNSRNNTK